MTDGRRKERISETIGRIDGGWIAEAAAYTAGERTPFPANLRGRKVQKAEKSRKIRKQLLAAAAGAAALLLLTVGVLQSGLFRGKTDILPLQGEETMQFAPLSSLSSLQDGKLDIIGDPRGMTAAEAQLCFGDRAAEGAFLFAPGEAHPCKFEGSVDGVKLTLLSSGMIADLVLEVDGATVSRIRGVDVRAGYFLTDRNSRGERQFLCLAEFTFGGYDYALELAGDERERETLEKRVADLLLDILERGGVPLDQIRR